MISRYDVGLSNLQKIGGDAGAMVIESLKNIAPDLAKYTIEYPFGDIYDRIGLSLRDREMVTISMLAALGNAAPQLKVHIHAALNAVFVAKEVFKEIDTK